jgi:succinoglycan biosynthesis protein ExoM
VAARKIDILLCTFRRPEVRDTLLSLDALDLPGDVAARVVVCDNDTSPSAQEIVSATAETMRLPVHYLHAPALNISVARNAGLDAATERGAQWVAFIDDDETADADWLARLLGCASQSTADAVFGPSLAEYRTDAPAWVRRRDYHSNHPVSRGGIVQTGHTCNALLRWADTPWQGERFDIARGRSGGEDTEYFFRLNRAGARFEVCDTAIVREGVAPERLSFRWIFRRKFRSGQSYSTVTRGAAARVALAASAGGKLLICCGAALILGWSRDRRNFWLLRGALHAGVIAGCLDTPQPEIYGTEPLR